MATGTCTKDGCPKAVYKAHMCWQHANAEGLIVQRRRAGYRRPPCLEPGCTTPRAVGGRCEGHQPAESQRFCRVESCRRRTRRGDLCRSCRELGSLVRCGAPWCRGRAQKDSSYCCRHDYGVDLIAADWYDQVVVDRMWWGHDPGRPPTVPELRALFGRGDEEGLGDAGMGARMGKPEGLVRTWRWLTTKVPAEAIAA